jgi:histone-lysine N-methyltransferase SETMAR
LKLHQLEYETLPHPAYSPDLSPTDYHFLAEKTFSNETSVKNVFEELIASRNSDFYKSGINPLISRWQKCIESVGAYFD